METKLKKFRFAMLVVFLVYMIGFFSLKYYFSSGSLLPLVWACLFPLVSFKIFNKQSVEARGREFGKLPLSASEADKEKYRKYKKYFMLVYIAIALIIVGYINYQVFLK